MKALFIAMTALATAPAVSTDVAALRAADQALLDAIAPGDRAQWAKTLTDDAVYVDENGEIFDRGKFLDELVPLPAGISGHLSIIEYRARIHGNTALVVHRDDERESYHGQALHAEYLMTETWLRRSGEWKLASVHAYVVATDPPAVPLSAALMDAYTGTYTMADLTYTIRRDGDHLMGAQGIGKAHSLLAETPDVLFTPGHPRTRMLFERARDGQVTRFIDRREGEDLIWTRQPTSAPDAPGTR